LLNSQLTKGGIVKKVNIMRSLIIAAGILSVFAVALPAQASAATPCIQRVFRWGSNDACVSYIQQLFNASVDGGSNNFISVDSSYGTQTTNAIRFLQGRTGLTVDGITGPNTWRQLCFRGGNNGFFTKDALQYGITAAVNAGCQAYGRPTAPLPAPL
jgi:peptidoglycan hydrolase-like protein with peptidoglycan-binding domain